MNETVVIWPAAWTRDKRPRVWVYAPTAEDPNHWTVEPVAGAPEADQQRPPDFRWNVNEQAYRYRREDDDGDD